MKARVAARTLRWLAPRLAALALLGLSPAAEGGGSTTMRVSATILSYVKVTSLVHPPALEVGVADVERGYVDLDSGTSLTLVTNSVQGAYVSAHADPATVAGVALRVDGHNSGGERAHVPLTALARTQVRIGYRLHLQPGVAPGRHPWPVTLAVAKS